MKKVLIPTKLDAVCRTTLEADGKYTVVQDDQAELGALCAANPDAYALVVRSEKITPEVIDALPALKVIIRAGAGFNTIDTRHARKRGIDVMNTPGANANAVAEEVVAFMLADARHLVKADPSCRRGDWEKKAFMGREITGKTVGVVGLGAIGRLVVRRLGGFDCTILGFDPFVSEDRAGELGVKLVDLPTLFAQSDFVTLHIPEDEQTRGLIDVALLGRMKAGATLINCARAGIVNEADLRAARAEKDLRFLNDVYAKDAAGPKSVADIADLMVPHLGANTKEANFNAARRAAQELIEFDEKGITSYIVNRDIPEGLDPAFGDLAHTLTRLCRAVAGRDAPLKLIETSFYGTLKPFADWLIIPIVAALNEDFDRSMDATAAERFLRESGVDYASRETDERKAFQNSMTIDLVVSSGGNALRRASVRGTVAEGNLMVARIDDFDKLYFEPRGHTVGFVYPDRPGVLGQIGKAMAGQDINIHDVRNPHDPEGKNSLAILKVNQAVPAATVAKTAEAISARAHFYIEL